MTSYSQRHVTLLRKQTPPNSTCWKIVYDFQTLRAGFLFCVVDLVLAELSQCVISLQLLATLMTRFNHHHPYMKRRTSAGSQSFEALLDMRDSF